MDQGPGVSQGYIGLCVTWMQYHHHACNRNFHLFKTIMNLYLCQVCPVVPVHAVPAGHFPSLRCTHYQLIACGLNLLLSRQSPCRVFHKLCYSKFCRHLYLASIWLLLIVKKNGNKREVDCIENSGPWMDFTTEFIHSIWTIRIEIIKISQNCY